MYKPHCNIYQPEYNGARITIHSYRLLVTFEILELIFLWSFEVIKVHDLCPSPGWWSSLFSFLKGILMDFKMKLDVA